MGPEGMRQGKRDKKKKNGEEHQSKQGMKTGQELGVSGGWGETEICKIKAER